MTIVYFSHTCNDLPELGNISHVEADAGAVADVISQLNDRYPGLRPRLVDDQGRVRSKAILVRNVVVEDGRIFVDKERSQPIKSLDEQLHDDENLLVSLFDAGFIESLLAEGLTPTSERFPYESEDGRPNRHPYRGYVLPNYLIEQEPVRAFVNSSLEISQLMFDLTDEIHFAFLPDDLTLDRFVRRESRVIPAPLVNAIYGLLTDLEEDDTPQVHLRLFQEDALFSC